MYSNGSKRRKKKKEEKRKKKKKINKRERVAVAMFRSKYALAAVGSATWALVSPKLRTRTTCESEERSDVKKEKEKDRYENEILAVYLTEESVQQVNKFLAKRYI